jgi:hypothetical protein
MLFAAAAGPLLGVRLRRGRPLLDWTTMARV